MVRRARITFEVIEQGDDITMHFDDERFPPIWFNKKQRPAAHSKLKRILDSIDVVEVIPDNRAGT